MGTSIKEPPESDDPYYSEIHDPSAGGKVDSYTNEGFHKDSRSIPDGAAYESDEKIRKYEQLRHSRMEQRKPPQSAPMDGTGEKPSNGCCERRVPWWAWMLTAIGIAAVGALVAVAVIFSTENTEWTASNTTKAYALTSVSIAAQDGTRPSNTTTMASSTKCSSVQLENTDIAQLPVSIDGSRVLVQCVEEARIDGHLKQYVATCSAGNWDRSDSCEMVLTDCGSLYDRGKRRSGVYTISPDGQNSIDVWCEHEKYNGGWTVIQRRIDGTVHFYRTWEEYKMGFGDLSGEFWLGNDNIHLLTQNQDQQMKIVMEHPNGTQANADYLHFWIEDEAAFYKLNIFGYSGEHLPEVDSFGSFHNGVSFTTKDQDHDQGEGNCALVHRGGWWYRFLPNACNGVNLNGVYGQSYWDGICWLGFTSLQTKPVYSGASLV